MAAATSLMRAQQLVLAAVEDELRPFGLTFASYEALMLLSFTRRGELPLGKMSERLMVHPASITNTVDRLEERGLVERRRDEHDRRRILAAITPAGRPAGGRGHGAAEQDPVRARAMLAERRGSRRSTPSLRRVRQAAGDMAEESPDPWQNV